MIQVIPAIDIIDGRCVRLTKGDYNAKTEYRALPVEMAKTFRDHGFTRLHLVDLSGAKAGHPENLKSLEAIANIADGMTIEWGGGIKTDSDVHSCFDAGASCVVSGSLALKQPELFALWLNKYGSEAISLGADARKGKVAVAGWLEDTDVTIESLFDRFIPDGLTQAIVTEISRDGMLAGPDTDLYTRLQKQYPGIIITVSGGISCLDDILHLDSLALKRVIVGKAIYEHRISLSDLAKLNY